MVIKGMSLAFIAVLPVNGYCVITAAAAGRWQENLKMLLD
jgi:hypothetical protein